MMTPEKALTLQLLRDGMGLPVRVTECRRGSNFQELRARLSGLQSGNLIPVLFLLTSLAFLEASSEEVDAVQAPDGWTPVDFLSHLRLEDGALKVSLDRIRGRKVCTDVSLSPDGELSILTRDRGQSATRWLAFVEGRSHLRPVSVS
jgi:hypothetical protein